MRYSSSLLVRTLIFFLAALGGSAGWAESSGLAAKGGSAAAPSPIFAKVGSIEISHDEFNAAFGVAARAKFYHGKPPEAEIAALQREVGEQLVGRILLLQETRKRGMLPDPVAIKKLVNDYDQRYGGSEQWKKNRDSLLPPLVDRLEQNDLLAQLEKEVRGTVKVTEGAVKAYYKANLDKFTEPEQTRISAIVLQVDPSAPAASWDNAKRDAQDLVRRARGGEDFAELARKYSKDDSAINGGDMGYVHNGMLPDGAQETILKMKVNTISDPLRVLQGWALFRLNGRKTASLRPFETVKERAQGLAQRERSDNVWSEFNAALRSKAVVSVDRSRFLPLSK